MLPSAERFVEGFAFFARRHAPLSGFDAAAMSAALAEAEGLAAGREEDEPAALFYACSRRSRAFGALAKDFVPFIARRQAQAVGRALEIRDIELDILRLRVVLRAIDFDDLRAELASRMRPLP